MVITATTADVKLTKVPGLTDEVTVPSSINTGLTCPTPQYLIELFGKPREFMAQECAAITNESLLGMIKHTSVGPFVVQGLGLAVDSLTRVMTEIRNTQPTVYAALGTAGMLCARLQRGSTTAISSHSWGTAIDLKLDGKLDVRGNNKCHYGLTLIAPIFNRSGWIWGAAFRVEDAMHFEVSKNKLEEWKAKGLLAQKAVRLALGAKGEMVRRLQEKLVILGFKLKPDGHFGPNTDQAVKIFQQRRGLKPDGVVGPKTREVLGLDP